MTKKDRIVIAQNRSAKFHYVIEDTVEAGIALKGTEVKSLRKSRSSLDEAYAGPTQGGLTLFNLHIPEYQQASYTNHEPRRARKILLHKRQIRQFLGKVQRQGYTLIPLKLYFNPKGLAKLELALAKGKKLHDKRESIKQREWDRSKQRILKGSFS